MTASPAHETFTTRQLGLFLAYLIPEGHRRGSGIVTPVSTIQFANAMSTPSLYSELVENGTRTKSENSSRPMKKAWLCGHAAAHVTPRRFMAVALATYRSTGRRMRLSKLGVCCVPLIAGHLIPFLTAKHS